MKTKQKVVVLAGTRPEAIKLAPVIHSFWKNKSLFETVVCATGQHKEMLAQAFNDFNIRPDLNLDIMLPDQTLAGVSARLFEGIDQMLASENPDWLIVQGDTTSVMVGALCAFYRNIRVGHVEAGLRSRDLYAPFPEELNRRVASLVTTKHFAPTLKAKENLLAEGVKKDSVFVTGNTVIDALLYTVEKIRSKPPELPDEIRRALSENKRMVLITGHRRENFGSSFEQICIAIRELSETFQDTVFVYPVHLNPNVQKPVFDILGGVERVFLTEALSYRPFVWLLDNSCLVLTDSGGIQEEAPSLGKPVLVMRNVTERPEGIEAGVSKLVGTNKETIFREVSAVLTSERKGHGGKFSSPYGDGLASGRIVTAIATEN